MRKIGESDITTMTEVFMFLENEDVHGPHCSLTDPRNTEEDDVACDCAVADFRELVERLRCTE